MGEDIEFIEDLSGLNGLKFHCRNKANPDQKGWTLVHSGHWGNWKPKIVHANMFVIGAKTKFGGRIGRDDIGMDGLKVKYDLVPYISGAPVVAGWHPFGRGIESEYVITMKWTTTTTTNEEQRKSMSNEIAMKISQGWTIPGLGDGGVEVGTTIAQESATTVSSTLSITK